MAFSFRREGGVLFLSIFSSLHLTAVSLFKRGAELPGNRRLKWLRYVVKNGEKKKKREREAGGAGGRASEDGRLHCEGREII